MAPHGSDDPGREDPQRSSGVLSSGRPADAGSPAAAASEVAAGPPTVAEPALAWPDSAADLTIGIPDPVQREADATVPRAQAVASARAAGQPRPAAAAAAMAPPEPTWGTPQYWDTGTLPALPQPGELQTAGKPAAAWAVHAAQIVALQLVLVGLLVAVHQPVDLLVLLVLGATALATLSLARPGDRWAYQWLGVWLRFRFRRRLHVLNPDAPTGELLSPFLRGVRLSVIEIDDVESPLLIHAGGLTVVLEVAPVDGNLIVEPAIAVPPPTALLPLGEEVGRPVSAQVVVQTTPAPGASQAHGVLAQSYQALANGMIPARRRSWIALQAMRTPADSDADDAELRAVLSRAVRRLQRRLQRLGLHGQVLDVAQLRTDLVGLTVAQAGGSRLEEHWASWSAGMHPQVTFRVLGWPDLGTQLGQEFFDRLVALPSVSTTVSVAARRTGRDEVELEAAVRVAVPPDQPDRVTSALRDLASRHAVRVQRMDGEHVFGVAASLPLGGFVT